MATLSTTPTSESKRAMKIIAIALCAGRTMVGNIAKVPATKPCAERRAEGFLGQWGHKTLNFNVQGELPCDDYGEPGPS
jgi:hypothetical protein